MLLPVVPVQLCELCTSKDEQVLRVVLFSRLREVERSSYHRFTVDDHHLVMGNGVGAVDLRGDTCVHEVGHPAVFLSALAPVENGHHRNTAVMGLFQSLRDWR
jgi:hypothetical protein